MVKRKAEPVLRGDTTEEIPVPRAKKSKPSSVRKDRPALCPEQKRVYDYAMAGNNLLVSGIAGSGKTVLLCAIDAGLKEMHGEECVHATATTGTASVHIEGRTLSSLIGYDRTMDDKTVEEQLASIVTTRVQLMKTLRKVRVIIVDEISYMDAKQFELFQRICVYLSPKDVQDRPFGKFQVILGGDPCQLQPVNEQNGKFFLHEKFRAAFTPENCFFLVENHRQNDDPVLQYVLMCLRLRIRTELMRRAFVRMAVPFGMRPNNTVNESELPHLFARKQEMDAYNQKHINELPGEKFTYRAVLSHNTPAATKLFRDIPKVLVLAVGACVRLTVNLDIKAGLSNGTMGTVTKLSRDKVTVRFNNGCVRDLGFKVFKMGLCKCSQVPLVVAKGITVHAGQGMTWSGVIGNLGLLFAAYHAYVFLSRAQHSKNVWVIGVVDRMGQWSPKIDSIFRIDADAHAFFTRCFGENVLRDRLSVLEKEVAELLDTK